MNKEKNPKRRGGALSGLNSQYPRMATVPESIGVQEMSFITSAPFRSPLS